MQAFFDQQQGGGSAHQYQPPSQSFMQPSFFGGGPGASGGDLFGSSFMPQPAFPAADGASPIAQHQQTPAQPAARQVHGSALGGVASLPLHPTATMAQQAAAWSPMPPTGGVATPSAAAPTLQGPTLNGLSHSSHAMRPLPQQPQPQAGLQPQPQQHPSHSAQHPQRPLQHSQPQLQSQTQPLSHQQPLHSQPPQHQQATPPTFSAAALAPSRPSPSTHHTSAPKPLTPPKAFTPSMTSQPSVAHPSLPPARPLQQSSLPQAHSQPPQQHPAAPFSTLHAATSLHSQQQQQTPGTQLGQSTRPIEIAPSHLSTGGSPARPSIPPAASLAVSATSFHSAAASSTVSTPTPSVAPSHTSQPLTSVPVAVAPARAPVAATLTAERKQQLLEKAQVLYQQQHRHSRTMNKQLLDLRGQLYQARQQQQVSLAHVLPTPPTFSSDPTVSPVTSDLSGSADPALLALLENSKAIEEALARKHTLMAHMATQVEQVEALVREQLDKEARRAEEDKDRRRRELQGLPARMRWQLDAIKAEEEDAVPLPPRPADPRDSPIVTSLNAHISALHHQNSLTQSLLLLKNQSLAQQQEQHSMLHDSLRAQIADLTMKSERRERENLEEREMLVGHLKTMIDSLAQENEQLKLQAKQAAAANAMANAMVQARAQDALPPTGFDSPTANGLNGFHQHNGVPHDLVPSSVRPPVVSLPSALPLPTLPAFPPGAVAATSLAPPPFSQAPIRPAFLGAPAPAPAPASALSPFPLTHHAAPPLPGFGFPHMPPATLPSVPPHAPASSAQVPFAVPPFKPQRPSFMPPLAPQ